MIIHIDFYRKFFVWKFTKASVVKIFKKIKIKHLQHKRNFFSHNFMNKFFFMGELGTLELRTCALIYEQ